MERSDSTATGTATGADASNNDGRNKAEAGVDRGDGTDASTAIGVSSLGDGEVSKAEMQLLLAPIQHSPFVSR